MGDEKFDDDMNADLSVTWEAFPPNLYSNQLRIPVTREIVMSDGMGIEEELKNGSRLDLDQGLSTFSEEYLLHRNRNYSNEYAEMVDEIAGLSMEKLGDCLSSDGPFIGIPTRGEITIDGAIELLEREFEGSDFVPKIFIYNNDSAEPDIDVRKALGKNRSKPNVFIFDRKVLHVGMGDIRGLIEDVIGEVAYRRKIEDPIMISTDADIMRVSAQGIFPRMHRMLRENQKKSFVKGRVELDPISVNIDPMFSLFREIRRVGDTVLDDNDLLKRGLMGGFYGIRLRDHFAIGGSPRTKYGEDKLLETKYEMIGEDQGMNLRLSEGCVMVDGSKDLKDFLKRSNRYTSESSFDEAKGGESRSEQIDAAQSDVDGLLDELEYLFRKWDKALSKPGGNGLRGELASQARGVVDASSILDADKAKLHRRIEEFENV